MPTALGTPVTVPHPFSELSRQDFDSSMRYIRAMKDKPLKLNAILDIIQAIRQWVWD